MPDPQPGRRSHNKPPLQHTDPALSSYLAPGTDDANGHFECANDHGPRYRTATTPGRTHVTLPDGLRSAGMTRAPDTYRIGAALRGLLHGLALGGTPHRVGRPLQHVRCQGKSHA